MALMPQVPGHGSLHLALMQAKLVEQSVLRTHSGRQDRYGSPKNPGRHLHAAARPSSEHSALSPHGLGSQGVSSASGAGVANIKIQFIGTHNTRFKHECKNKILIM